MAKGWDMGCEEISGGLKKIVTCKREKKKHLVDSLLLALENQGVLGIRSLVVLNKVLLKIWLCRYVVV